MPSNVVSMLVFVVNALTSLYLLLLVLRFWLPWMRADFRNPLAQGILKLTSPLVVPIRRVVPSFGRLDTSTVLVAFVVQYLALLLILLIVGASASFSVVAISAIVKLVLLSLNLFMFAIFVRIILSWISPGQNNPATAIITTLTEPILRPFRRVIPSMGGFDISPVFAIIALGALTRLLMGFNQLGF
jgi:YggT family protein